MLNTSNKKQVDLEKLFAVRSEKLKELRAVIGDWEKFNVILGGVAQFRLVVDTNVVLGDILWLVAGRTNKLAKTHLMEVVDAETVFLFAPPTLLDEVDEKIPLLAEEKCLDVDEMYAQWAIYKTKITIVEPDIDKARILRNGADPDDADFLALAETIGASGVISKDRHIAMMGGNQISIACITYLREYSRAAAIELNIKINGVRFVFHGTAAAKGIFSGMRLLIERIKRAPDWLKIALIAGGLFVAIHPEARARVSRCLKVILAGINDATPAIISFITDAALLAETQKAKAEIQLNRAMNELERFES
jgi:predicted nucleic acid-binding protein